MDISPNNYRKIGTWTNGTYFNALSLEAQSKDRFKKFFGVECGFGDFVGVADTYFRSKSSNECFMGEFGKNPSESIQKYTETFKKVIRDLREYIDNDTSKTELGDYELLRVYEDKARDALAFLWTYLEISDIAEAYFIKSYPDLKFEDVTPSEKISSEKLHEEVSKASNGQDLETIRVKWDWYGINLMRAPGLSMDYLKEIQSRPYVKRDLKIPENAEVHALQDLMWLKFERIDIINYVLYAMRPLVQRLLSSKNIDLKYWEVLTPDELHTAIETGTLPAGVDDRYSKRIILIDNEVVRHGTNDEYEKLYDIFLNTKVERTNILKGRSACKGIVSGNIVCVYNPDEIIKVKDGDILVINETLVQQEPYLHKTKGMIVQMAGLLCHSAIFAREFKIPTVIGVSEALKILKDGDQVELDADNGVLRILNK